MLAIKTVLADTDSIETLIFDEIDTGISGRTAQMVSEKPPSIRASSFTLSSSVKFRIVEIVVWLFTDFSIR